MTHTAILRFAPAYDTRHFTDDPSGAPNLVVGHDALKRVKRDVPTPVVIDHDPEKVVGHVRDVWVHDDVDYGTRVRRWWFASCEITDAPDWLKRGGAVSWRHFPLHSYDIAGTTVLTMCLFDEVSLLTPATQPAEPLARVMLVERAAPQPTAESEGGEVILGGGVIRRPGIGRVLAVGGQPVRTNASRPLRRSGMDYIVDHEDGSQTLYHDYREALRDSVAR